MMRGTSFGSLSDAASHFLTLMLLTACQQTVQAIMRHIAILYHKTKACFFQEMQIQFLEFPDDYSHNRAYDRIGEYLGGTCIDQGTRLKGKLLSYQRSINIALDETETVVDRFCGIKIKWTSGSMAPDTVSKSPARPKRFHRMTFPRSKKKMIVDEYLPLVMEEGKEISGRNRQRRLFTNNSSTQWSGYRGNLWSSVMFDHPATFDTIAMDPKKKEEIISELVAFKNGKDFYATAGRAWKRGYLLYGPPGTGKSSMIAAIANFMDYNVYDIELTAVKQNLELRKLLSDISSKSVVVIEDIDCSIDLTGKRNETEKKEEDAADKKVKPADDDKTKVTLSGLLNFIDGLWSSSGSERIILFTTNHKDKLDPALIRRGRMDQHIELSYCRFEAFKVLVKNYLRVDSHPLFEKIGGMLEETDMTPADVVEHIMPRSAVPDVDACLETLIQELKSAKEKAAKKKEEAEAKKEEANAKEKVDADAKKKVEADAKKKVEAEAKKKEDADAKKKEEAEAKKKVEADAKQEVEADAKQEVEADAKQEVEADAKQEVEADAKQEVEADAKQKVEAEEGKEEKKEEGKEEKKEEAVCTKSTNNF